MDVIYQAADKDFNFFEAQVRELDAESIITSIFRTLTGTKHRTRRQVTCIPPMLITPGAANPTTIPSMAAPWACL